MLQAIIRRLKREKRGISTVIVVMLSLVLVVIIVGNVILWSYQMNQLDLERMQETVTIANVTRATTTSWYTTKNEYITNGGTCLNGTYVDTQSIDSKYETFREETTLTNYTFNPSGYVLGGSTSFVSGAVSDLATDNSAFTGATVNTTLQLYNYYTGQYPTSGDGYINYASSSTPNTDETRSQAIVANPTYYRNSTGAWKIRITGVKDTTSPFDLKLDWGEFKTSVAGIYRLNITNTYRIDLQTCPIDYIHDIEILLRYNVSNSDEKWFLKAYNWTASSFSEAGFNNTGGSQPTLGQWNEYAINVTSDWTDYIAENGTILIEFSDEGISTNQTVVEIDFLGARAIIDGTRLDLKNSSPLSLHIVAIWITNSTIHQRYSANLFMNSGESSTYIRADIRFPQDAFIAKVVTERGNIAVFSNG